jgi:hypothetical protein
LSPTKYATPTGAPASAPSLTATPGCGKVDLSWITVSGASGYRLHRDGSEVWSGASTSYLDQNLTGGAQYSYKVSAYNSCGEGPFSSSKSATPTAGPSAPNLTATPGCSKVDLSWTQVSGATGYKLSRDGTVICTGANVTYSESRWSIPAKDRSV